MFEVQTDPILRTVTCTTAEFHWGKFPLIRWARVSKLKNDEELSEILKGFESAPWNDQGIATKMTLPEEPQMDAEDKKTMGEVCDEPGCMNESFVEC